MSPTLTKVVFKPDVPHSTEEFIVIAHAEEYKKWKAGETSIPLVDVVDSFAVFHSIQGSQGLLQRPSQQQLDTTFGTHKDVDVVTQILQKGKDNGSDGISSLLSSVNNTSRGGVSDNRGKQSGFRS